MPTTDALFPLAKLAEIGRLDAVPVGAPLHIDFEDRDEPPFADAVAEVVGPQNIRIHRVIQYDGDPPVEPHADWCYINPATHLGAAALAFIAARILGASEEEACGAFWHCTTPWVHPDGHTCPAEVWLFAPIDYRGHASWPTTEDVRTPTGRAAAILAVMERLCGVGR